MSEAGAHVTGSFVRKIGPIWGACIAAILTIALTFGALLWRNYNAVLAEAEREAVKDVSAFTQLTALNYGNVDALLGDILAAAHLVDAGAAEADGAIMAELQRAEASLLYVRQVVLFFPPAGPGNPQIHQSHRGLDRGNLFPMTGELIALYKAANPPALHIGQPLLDAGTGRSTVPVSRALYNTDGSIRAIAIAFVDSSILGKVYVAFHYGDLGSVSLYRSDGVLLAREPHSPPLLGKSFANGPTFAVHLPRADAGVFRAFTAIDGVERIVAFSRVPRLPLVVLVGRGVPDILSPWYGAAIGYSVAFVLLTALFVAMAALYSTQKQRLDLARERQEASDAHLRSIVEGGYEAIVSVAGDGTIVEWNSQAGRMFGWTDRDAVGQPFGRLVLPEELRAEHAARLQVLTTAAEGAMVSKRGEGRFRRRDGKAFPAEFTTLASQRHGRSVGTYIINDTTERQSLLDRSRQAERLAAVGQLTGGVAHEFNNLLAAILGNAEFLKDELRSQPKLADVAETIERSVDRGAELTHRLLAFSRKQPLRPRVFDVGQLLQDIISLARPLLGENVALTLAMSDAQPLRVNLDAGQLQGAVLNLIINARDAMPRGGSIRVVAEAGLPDDTEARSLGVRPGRFVRISVIDNGSGMSPDVMARAVEPFFTTKDVGKGTGLGLSMVHGFMSQSGGTMRIESWEGDGTRIMLLIPAAATDAPAGLAHALRPSAGAGQQTVLMVEDDADVLIAGARLLRSIGYHVVEAPDGPSAVHAVAGLDRLDIVFTDVILPRGMSGLDVAKAAREKFPDVPVVFTSGYNENVIVHEGRVDPGVTLLRKPYNLARLAAAFEEAIQTSSSSGRPKSARMD